MRTVDGSGLDPGVPVVVVPTGLKITIVEVVAALGIDAGVVVEGSLGLLTAVLRRGVGGAAVAAMPPTRAKSVPPEAAVQSRRARRAG